MANALEKLREQARQRKLARQQELEMPDSEIKTQYTDSSIKDKMRKNNILTSKELYGGMLTPISGSQASNTLKGKTSKELYGGMPTPISGSQASNTLKGETSNTAFSSGVGGAPDTDQGKKGVDNRFGFDKSVDRTATSNIGSTDTQVGKTADFVDTSPTVNVLDNIGEGGYDSFFSHVVKSAGMQEQNVDPLFAEQLRKEYEPLFAQAGDDPNRLNQLSTSLATALAGVAESQKTLNKLDYDKNSILAQFSNGEEVAANLDKLKKLIENGETDPDVLASQMGMSRDDILRAQQGDFSGFGAKLEGPALEDVSEDINLAMDRAEEDYNTINAQLERRLNEQMEDEAEALKRAERQAQISEVNMNKLAGLTGVGFSSLGATGIAEAHQQTRDFLNDIRKNYGRAKQSTKDALEKLSTDYARQSDDYRKNLEDRIEAVSNSFFSNVQAIKDRYGEVSTKAIVELGNAAMDYQKTIHNQRRDYAESHRQDIATFNSMKDQLMQEETWLREQETLDIQDFVNNSLNSTYGNILASVKSGEYTPEYGRKLMAGMQQSIIKTLDSASGKVGVGNVFAQEIERMLSQNMTPAEIMDEIMTGEEFKKYAPVQALGGDKYRYFGGDVVDSSGQPVSSSGPRPTGGPEGGYRTDRHNNPTALMWTPGVEKFFKDLGYEVGKGDPFPNDPSKFTLDMTAIDDPVQATMDYIDSYGFTYSGGNRWSHTTMSDAQRNSKSNAEKRAVIKDMYKKEVGSGEIFGEGPAATVKDSLGDVSFDNLLDSFAVEDLITLSDIASLNGNQRLKYFEENPERQEKYAFYNQVQDAVDADSGVPLSYRMSVWHEIPNRQKDNVQEREDINEQIKKMYDMGISKEEAPLFYAAFEVENPEDRDFAMELVNVHKINAEEGIVQQKVKYLSDFVNNGQYEQAVTLIENDLIERIDQRAVVSNAPTEPKAIAVVSKMQRTIDVINELGAEDVGLFGGSIQKMLKKLKGPEVAYLNALLTDNNVQQMVEYIGADMTKNEVRALAPVFPDINDKVSNLVAKLQQMQDNAVEKHNAVRTGFFLPELTPEQLVSGSEGKADAYIKNLNRKEQNMTQGDYYRISQALINDQQEYGYTDEDFAGTVRED